MMKRLITVILLVAIGLTAAAQKRKVQNKPYIDLRPFHFGISMGLNLQESNRIVYFTLPLSSEQFEQSKKRIHRIGQKQTCFYYLLICQGSVEEQILQTLEQRKDYTDALFEEFNP